MSRIANKPIELPKGVEFSQDGQVIRVKGPKGEFSYELHALVNVENNDNVLQFSATETSKNAIAQAGTARANVNNIVVGLTAGFEKKLLLNGVGYRAQLQGSKINLTLGYSHPVVYALPEGVTGEVPDQTTIILKSADKQKLGQVAAEIRAKRPPEPYKGKGIRYADENIIRKETKKK